MLSPQNFSQLMLPMQQFSQNQLGPAATNVATIGQVSSGSQSTTSDIKIQLENADLWQKFHQHTTEMIVNKTGRRMFPTLRFKITGLEPSTSYAVFLEIAPSDECRYKYQNGRWLVNGRADPLPVSPSGGRCRLYTHPDSPAPGHLWMRQPLSFHRIKLTNNLVDPQGNVLLNSMHKYQPRLYILRLHDYFPTVPQLVAYATFPETAFVTVTAYQNNSIIQLKIDHNPFAKGFRENGLHGDNKKRSASSTKDMEFCSETQSKKNCLERSEDAVDVTPSLESKQESESGLNGNTNNSKELAVSSSSPAGLTTDSASRCPSPPILYSPVNAKEHRTATVPSFSPISVQPQQNPLAAPFFPAGLSLAAAARYAFPFPTAASSFPGLPQFGFNSPVSNPCPNGTILPPVGVMDPTQVLLAAASGIQRPMYVPPLFLPKL